jgi:hypothetical protein
MRAGMGNNERASIRSPRHPPGIGGPGVDVVPQHRVDPTKGREVEDRGRTGVDPSAFDLRCGQVEPGELVNRHGVPPVGRHPQPPNQGRPTGQREVSWHVTADSVVAWGGALGAKNPGGAASVGPGYDHSAVPGRTPLVIDRRGGAFYEEQWQKVLRRPPHFIMVETWIVVEAPEFAVGKMTLSR